jgi:WD40 repeat protein
VRYGDWMNYWIFQTTDPSDVQDIREGEDDTWRASQNRQQMSEGDLAFFWLGGPPEIRGVYGWGTLLSGSQPSDDQFEVKVRYSKRFASHLSALTIKKRNGPESLPILRQAQGTNFILTREEAQGLAAVMEPGERPPVPPIPAELIESIRAGECVLFAGAGLSARAGVPTWNQFLSGLLDFASERQIVDPATKQSFAAALSEGERNAVADGLVHAFGNQRDQLQEFLVQSFPEPKLLSQAHECIRQIPFAAVLTTNYDTLLEKTLPEFAEPSVYTTKDADSLLDALAQNRKFILKLYGLIRRPETLIFAPIEYQEAVSSNVSFSKFVEGIFFSRSFFFVGLSLEGIQDFLSGFVFRGAIPRRHFALVAVSGASWKAKADFLERRFNVRVIDYAVSESFPEFETFLEGLTNSVALPSSIQSESQSAPVPLLGIRKVILEDIGSFERLELDFAKDQWKILLGDNGVGKSTVLKAIAAAVIGSDARSYAGRLVRAGKTRGRIIVTTERNPHGYITEILTKDMLSDCDVLSMPSRLMEAEGWLVLGFSPLRSVTWTASTGPQPIVQKGRPTADDLIPLLSGEVDPRMDRLKQWIVNLDAADKPHQSVLQGHRDRVSALVFGPDGRTLISGSIDKTIRIWDSWAGQELRKIDAHEGGVNDVAVTGDGKTFVSGAFDHKAKAWDVDTGRLLETFEGSQSQILTVSLTANGKLLAAGSEGGSIRLWHFAKSKKPKLIPSNDGPVWSVAISADGGTIVGGCDGGTIKVYEAATGRELKALKARGGPVWSIALAADGQTLVSGTEDGAVAAWNLKTGRTMRTLQAKGAGTLSVAVSADGQTAAAGAEDGTFTVWEVGSGRVLLSSVTGTRGVWSVALSRDGRTAAAGSDDRTIRVWSLPDASASTPQQGTIKMLFEVIAGLTDRADIDFLRVNENYRVMVRAAEAPTGVPLELLSQGLTSLLGWVGYLCQRLKETAQESNSGPLPTDGYALVLIDELDAHMHPRWQQVLVPRLKKIFPNVQFIVSTHSPLIVGGLETSEVVRFDRDSAGVVQVTIPDHALKGVGAAGLLTSDMFGLTSHLDSETAEALDRKRQLTAKVLDETLSTSEKLSIEEELKKLEETVKYVDATGFVRDPLYKQFVEAMTQVEIESESESPPVMLTPEEKKAKADTAAAIVRNLVQKTKKKESIAAGDVA